MAWGLYEFSTTRPRSSSEPPLQSIILESKNDANASTCPVQDFKCLPIMNRGSRHLS